MLYYLCFGIGVVKIGMGMVIYEKHFTPKQAPERITLISSCNNMYTHRSSTYSSNNA